ncbi:MAG: MFS transporter [Chloroflexota bacterium]
MNQAQVAAPDQDEHVSFRRLVSVGMGTKFVIDICFQLFTPFLPIFAAGFGVNILTMGRLLSLLNGVGITAPIFSMLAARHGYRAMLRLAILFSLVGILFLALTSQFWMTIVGISLLGIGLAAFAPMLHAYLSQKISYAQRARGIGIVEFSWALSSIVGLSLIGQLIAWTNWRVPLFVLAGGLVVAWGAYGILPSDRPNGTVVKEASSRGLKRENWQVQLQQAWAYFFFANKTRAVWGAILVYALNYFGMLHVIIVHSVWLTEEYGLDAKLLGLVALVIGLADLGGSGLVSLVSDRLGKRKSIILGTVGSLLVYLTLPLFNINIFTVIVSLVLLRLTFEFSLVSNLPLLSEIVPDQRGKVLTLNVVVSLMSGIVVGFSGPWAYTTYGVWGLGPVSAIAVLLSLFLLWRWVEEVRSV